MKSELIKNKKDSKKWEHIGSNFAGGDLEIKLNSIRYCKDKYTYVFLTTV